MSEKSRVKKEFMLPLVLVLLLLQACSSLISGKSDEDIVKVRAAERWKALIEGRLETAYQYHVPEYRDVYSYKHYRRKVARGVGLWQKADVTRVECAEDKCIATLTVYVKIYPGKGFEPYDSSGTLMESWTRDTESGEWFFYPESKNF